MLTSRDSLLSLFIILVFGSALGRVSFRGFSFGSAGVLLFALVLGHFGFRVDKGVSDLGLVLFVYSVGLSAAPRFFRSFQRAGWRYFALAIIPVTASAAAVIGIKQVLNLNSHLTLGIFTGALTNTPALAAALDTLGGAQGSELNSAASVSFGVAYPFGILSVILIVQVLPRILRKNLNSEQLAWQIEQRQDQPDIVVKHYRVTNPNIVGKSIRELNPRQRSHSTITRIARETGSVPASPELVLQLGDLVTVVGHVHEVDMMQVFLGAESASPLAVSPNISVLDLEITAESLVGQPLSQLHLFERHHVTVTRIRRHGSEMLAEGHSCLDFGDTIRVVGESAAVESFVKLAGARPHLIDETSMLPFLAGLLLGVVVGAIPLPLAGSLPLKLGPAGGAFITSILIGHYRRLGPFGLYVPQAAKNLCRELGLLLFLAGAGTSAGAGLMSILSNNGWALIAAGAIVTLSSIVTFIILSHFFYKQNLLATLGGLCGCMQNASALSNVSTKIVSELPALTYASVYPLSLIFKIICAQMLAAYL